MRTFLILLNNGTENEIGIQGDLTAATEIAYKDHGGKVLAIFETTGKSPEFIDGMASAHFEKNNMKRAFEPLASPINVDGSEDTI